MMPANKPFIKRKQERKTKHWGKMLIKWGMADLGVWELFVLFLQLFLQVWQLYLTKKSPNIPQALASTNTNNLSLSSPTTSLFSYLLSHFLISCLLKIQYQLSFYFSSILASFELFKYFQVFCKILVSYGFYNATFSFSSNFLKLPGMFTDSS